MSYNSKFEEVFKKVSIDSYADFSKEMKLQWNRLKNQHYDMEKSCQFYDCKDLVRENLKNRFSVYLGNVLFDLLLKEPEQSEDKKNLFVIFTASREPSEAIPVFKRNSYMPFCPGYVLNVSDPMLSMYKQLRMGWFYGTRKEAYIEYLAVIVNRIRELLGIENRNVYFFGSSAGGYASLQISNYLDGTNHIAVNPQIDLKQTSANSMVSKLLGATVDEKDPFRRNETSDIIKENISTNRYLIIQNLTDENHCSKHLFPMLKNLNVSELNYGLNQVHDNMLVWIYDVIGGHVAQGDRLIFSQAVYMAMRLSSPDFRMEAQDNFLFQNFSCVWRMRDWYKNVIDTK